MAGKPCAKCDKNVKWLSQNKIEGIIYCEDCWKELTQEKEKANELENKEKKAANELKKKEKKAANELKKKEKKEKKATKGLENKENKADSGIIRKIFREKERIILFITAAILALILLFPPFHSVYKGIEINSGYTFILRPPIPSITDLEVKFASNINVALLVVQYLFTVTIGGILWFVFKKDNSSATKEQRPVNSRVVR